jgi:hypothetical protein
MSKRKISTNKMIIVGVLLLLLSVGLVKFVSYWQLNGEMHYDKDPYIDTQFTKSFTFEKFDAIRKGMTVNDVIDLIGQPFERNIYGSATNKVIHDKNAIEIPPPDFTQDCWSYSRDGKLGDKGDTSWYSYVVCFKQGQVVSTVINEFFD